MENKVKNRAWVKDAAIIFLAVLLVLTFFSSTIMNRSLTEAATEEVKSGTITAKVRGKGIVEANGTNKVKATGTVTIAKTMVKAGDEVKADDILFVLGAGDSEELEAAKELLDDLQMSYDQALTNLPVNDGYTSEYATIAARQRELDAAIENLKTAEASLVKTSGDKNELSKLVEEKNNLTADINKDKAILAELTYELDSAKSQLDSAMTSLNYLRSLVNSLKSASVVPEYEPEISEGEEILSEEKGVVSEINESSFAPSTGDEESAQSIEELEAQVFEMLKKVDALSAEYAKKQNELTTSVIPEENILLLEKRIAENEAKLNAVNAKIEQWNVSNSEYLDYKEAENAVAGAEEALTIAQSNLQYSAAQDGRSYNSAYLSAQAIKLKIDRQKEKIKTLAGEGEENVITAKTAGIVSEVNCASGDSVVKGDILAVIEVPDMGYTISFSVTNDQARRLKIGDKATISNFYWGNEITATLKSIATDKKNPQTQKLLTFDVEGDVNAGAELTVSVGQKSASYDLVIPNSAIRNDNNGSFVYVVEAKNSPVGNRYIAKRVKIEVLASDDTNSAVTADMESGDFVITTTGAPIKNGEQVRLANTAS
ncbi:MAG: HlyD family efflux transporter periplasmic adaptor subunit [Eubacteriales bacterium]|nr:HlyD family efflux transporter periplasmic adaptor subunit [Eubacteriales bacterium]